ncbi:DsbA family protein [Paracoccus sp. (in: a-proteobacteria)]|uniref:DsbA family protein n=1 Tax=Paracoccus sp. TaxID=267 RepID=UPI0026DFD75B|nr:DsbA family protein [Paracoccus sp. (in: a-proteobacteria)]MDO5646867.1 DsbA family protein [Paracoccus sp. (in: a-proteobacteria)]
MKRLIAALMLTATPAIALDLSAMTDTEKTAFGEAVRAYLMENPEVLIESINVLETRQAEAAAQTDVALVAANRDALFDDGHSWVGGNPDGDLTIVEFIDYRCGYCRRVNDDVHTSVEDDGNIRLILKEYPILGQDSDTASRFAIAVQQIAGDDAYLAAHHALMEMRGTPSPTSLGAIARDIGVDGDEVLNRMNTESVTDVLRANRQLGDRMNIRGTPTFVIGDTMLRGVPHAGIAETIQAVRQGM